jgi:glycosyltransferase involved in cell wall biosynthesis
MLPKNTRIGLLAPISWPIPPHSYGAWERVVTNLANGLVEKGYKNVTLFATKQAKIKKVKTVALIDKPLGNSKKNRRVSELLHIAYSLSAAKVDILHNHFNYHPLLFSKFVNFPIVTTMHGSGMEAESKIGYSYYYRLPFVSISDFERSFVPKLNYIATVYNSVDEKTFKFNPRPKEYLVNAGRIHPTKGVHNAISLAKKVKIPIYLAGPVDSPEYFEKQIKPFIDNKTVIYLGNLTARLLAKLVAFAKALVALTEWGEPFGLSVAEAMYCGTPVIASNRGSHVEIVKEGLTGIRADSTTEAIKKFHQIDSVDREKCRKTAVELFSISTMTEGYLKAYSSLI